MEQNQGEGHEVLDGHAQWCGAWLSQQHLSLTCTSLRPAQSLLGAHESALSRQENAGGGAAAGSSNLPHSLPPGGGSRRAQRLSLLQPSHETPRALQCTA